MRVRIGVLLDDEVIEDSLSISTSGPEVGSHDFVSIGKDVSKMLKRAEHTLALRYDCHNCRAKAGEACKPDYGCDDDTRATEGQRRTAGPIPVVAERIFPGVILSTPEEPRPEYYILEHPTRGTVTSLDETDSGRIGRYSWSGSRLDAMRFPSYVGALDALKRIEPAWARRTYIRRAGDWEVVGP